MRHKGGGHKQHYRIVDFKRNKDGIPAKVERLEYDPNRSANLALLLYTDGERRYIIAPRGVAVGTQLMSGIEAPIKPGNCAAAAQHPGRHDRALHRDAAGQGRADCALGRRRRCSCWRAKASTRSCGFAPAKSARCTSTAARRSAKSATKSTACARSARPAPTAGAASVRRCAASAMNPVDHPHGGRSNGGGHPVSPWGTPTKGYKTRSNKRTDVMIVRRRHATKG